MLNLNTVLSSLCDRGGSTDKIIMLNNTIIHRSQQQTKSSCSNKIVMVKQNRNGQTPRPTELTLPVVICFVNKINYY